MATPEWCPLQRNYGEEKIKLSISRIEVTNHPLSSIKLKTNEKTSALRVAESVSDPLSDPLGAISLKDPLSLAIAPINDPLLSSVSSVDDPLSARNNKLPETKIQNIETVRQAAQQIQQSNLNSPWQLKKLQKLKDYVIEGNITLNSSAINDFAGSGVEDGSNTRHLDRYEQRLATLERRQISNDKVEMTQKEYEAYVNKLAADLHKAWANDERVNSLKVAIQLAKLLSDSTVPQFYPYMFVVITDVLDQFGDMVYNRLKARADEALNEGQSSGKKKVKLSDNFTADEVPAVAKETCRNWFYKVSCIRELLPRIYVEIALFKCYRFLTESDYPPVFSRLASIIRGLGDPLVAVYARTYLVVVGNEIAPQINGHAISMLEDTLFSSYMLKEPYMLAEFERSKLTEKTYFYLLSPGIDWLVRCVGRSASKDVFQSILQMYRTHSNDAMVLKHIIENFDATHYAHGSLGMVTLIKASIPSCYTIVDLFSSLGKQLSIYPPPEDQRMPLLNEVWKIVIKSTETLPYVRCCLSWVDLIQKYYSERELLVLLSNLSNRLQAHLSSGEPLTDAIHHQLEALVSSLIGQSSTFGTAVLTSEHLLKIMDVFKGPKKVALCKDILESFKTQKNTNDAVLINAIFDLARTVHDSVDLLSPDGERNYIATLLCTFIDKIDFGRDLEHQLNFYVECRAVFCNLDKIKDKLILCVSGLALKTLKFVKGRHSKKTSTFIKACLAYCHITVPSIENIFRKLELLLHCSQVALLNQCLPQTDTFLKAAITLIPEMPAHYEADGNKKIHYEDRLSSYLLSLISTLVVTPGHPEHGPFYIVQGLINAVPRYQWQTSTTAQTRVFTGMLALLCTYAQRKFPYHINGVEANDDLYCSAVTYITELNENIQNCVDEILKQLSVLGEKTESSSKVSQAVCTIDLINQVAIRMKINKSVGAFIIRLCELVMKNKSLFTRTDQRYFSNTIQFIITKVDHECHEPASDDTGVDQVFIDTLKSYLK